jgi:hypothetical protein
MRDLRTRADDAACGGALVATTFRELCVRTRLARLASMRALLRLILVLLVVLAGIGCVYGSKRRTGTNLPTGDPGGPWTQGEQTGGGGGGPAALTGDR